MLARHKPLSTRWQPYRFYRQQLPPATRAWLLDQGSLTRRLIRASAGDFRVQIVRQQWLAPRAHERRLLDMAARETAIVREVLLLCHHQPWVFARTVIPASTLRGRLRHLRKFAARSLGEMLFRDPSMHRCEFELASIDGYSTELPAAVRHRQLSWGRRSRFELDGRPLMVSEIFLPAFRP